jgi:hypothetical protein
MVVCRFMLVKVKYMYMDLQIGYFDSQIQTEAPESMGSYPWGPKFNVAFSGENLLAILISYIVWKCSLDVSSYIHSWKSSGISSCRSHDLNNSYVLFLFTIVLSFLELNFKPHTGEVYSIQQYVINFVSDLRQFGGFLRFPPRIKTDHHNINKILLKVALNTIPLTPHPISLRNIFDVACCMYIIVYWI